MFDIGGWEFLLIGMIAIVVIGPKDLPGTIRTVTGWIRRARSLASEFQSGLDDIARETELDTMKDDLKSDLGLDDIADAGNSIRNDIEQSIDPAGDMADEFKEDFDLADDDDPFLKDYAGEDEDDELDDIDPKYKTADQTPEQGPGDVEPAKTESTDTEPVETVKKA